jgi:hypothetical protein
MVRQPYPVVGVGQTTFAAGAMWPFDPCAERGKRVAAESGSRRGHAAGSDGLRRASLV